MRVDGAFFVEEGQRRFGAASSHFSDGEVAKEREKGLQDKGSASLALLSVCLHIFLSRDTVSPKGDRTKKNGRNPPLNCPNRELRPRSPSYFRAAAVGLLVGVLLS